MTYGWNASFWELANGMPAAFYQILKDPINDTLFLLGLKMDKAKLEESLRKNSNGKQVTEL